MEKERKERNRLAGERKQLDFPRIVQKWDPMGKNRENLLVRCLELRINGAHMGTGNEMQGKKTVRKRFVVDSVEMQNARFTVSAVAVSIFI